MKSKLMNRIASTSVIDDMVSRSGSPRLDGVPSRLSNNESAHMTILNSITSVQDSTTKKIQGIKGNYMKLEKEKFMRNPMGKIRLSKGIMMKDESGALLG